MSATLADWLWPALALLGVALLLFAALGSAAGDLRAADDYKGDRRG